MQIPDAQALPKNTVLEGHVDQVQASDHKSDSMMVVTFDKAKAERRSGAADQGDDHRRVRAGSDAQQAAAGTPASEGQPMPMRSPHRRRSACRRWRDEQFQPQHAERTQSATDECACGRVRFSAGSATEWRPGCDSQERYSPAQFGDVHVKRAKRTCAQWNADAGSPGDHSSRRNPAVGSQVARPLFVAQRVDGIHRCGAIGGQGPENDAYAG